MKADIGDIADQIGVEITDRKDSLLIRTKLRFWDSNDFGHLLAIILCFCVFGYVLVKEAGSQSWIIFLLLLPLLIHSLFRICTKLTNFVKVSSNKIVFRYNFRTRSYSLHPKMKILMKVDLQSVKDSETGQTRHYRLIAIFLKNKEKEEKILQLKVDDKKHGTQSTNLGTLILHKIKKRIDSSRSNNSIKQRRSM